MSDYLPPVVTSLEGEITGLAAKLAEATALIDAFNENVARKSTASGSTAGKNLMSEFEKALQEGKGPLGTFGRVLGDAEKISKDTGDVAGKGFVGKFIDWLGNKSGGLVDALGKIPFVGALFRGLGNAMNDMPPQAQIAIAGGIAAAIVAGAAFIGAALNGVILGALGGGAIAIGIYNELDHPLVHAALTEFTTRVDTALGMATNAFGPALVHNFQIATDAASRFLDYLRPTFAALAPITTQLTEALAKGLQEFAPGLQAGLQASMVVLQEFARDLPGLMNSWGIFWQQLAGGSKGAAAGLHDLIITVEGLTIALGWVVGTLSKLWGLVHDATTGIGDLFGGKTGSAAAAMSGVVEKVAASMNNVAANTRAAATAMDAYSTALDKALGITLAQDQANLQVQQDMFAFSATIQQNGQHWNDNTKAAADNMQALRQYVGDAEQARLANIAAGQSAIVATENYNDEVDKLLAVAGATGMTKQQLDALKGKYEIDVNEYWHEYFQSEGTPPAEFYHGLASGGFVAPNGIIHAAQGLLPPRSPGTLVLAGEPQTGGEVMIPQRGISQQRAAALGTVAMAPYGLDVGPAGGGAAQPPNGDNRPIVVQLVVDGRVLVEQVVIPYMLQNKRQYGSLGL